MTTENSAGMGLRSRREIVTGIALVVGGVAASASAAGQMEQKPAAAGNAEKTAIHEEVEFKASPAQIYAALLDAKQFAALTGAPAVIDAKAGGAFSLFGGQIEGRTVELVENVRVVQAWRPANWTAGDYSLVEFQLKPQGTGTLLIFDHKGFPKGDYDHLLAGWHEHYWAALKKV